MTTISIDRRTVLKTIVGSLLAISGHALRADDVALASSALPFNRNLRTLALSKRKVFAHWHWFPTSFDNKDSDGDLYATYLRPSGENGKYQECGGYIRERPLPRPPRNTKDWAVQDMIDEIKLASSIGLDGFQLNLGGTTANAKSWSNFTTMLEAALKAQVAFSIMPSFDCATNMIETPIEDISSAILHVARHSSLLRSEDGRLVLGAFAAEKWPVQRWRTLFNLLSRAGQPIYFMPHFLDVRQALPYLQVVDAASIWGGNHMDQFPILSAFAQLLRLSGKAWAAPVWPQDFRPKNLWFSEAENSKLFRYGWMEAMRNKAEFVIISTWNDYSEHSEIRPSTGIQYAFFDLAAFYAAWFKIGVQPTIIRDVLYYIHRIESTVSPSTGMQQPKRFYNRFSESASNRIELLSFLTESGRVEIETDSYTVTADVSSGISSTIAPIELGQPRFRLLRNGSTKLSFESAFVIRDVSAYQDLLYRAGSSSRHPVSK